MARLALGVETNLPRRPTRGQRADLPSEVRTSIFQGAMSASLIGLPNLTPGLGIDGRLVLLCRAAQDDERRARSQNEFKRLHF
jgi:hypothetical protein